MNDFLKKLRGTVSDSRIRENEPMSRHTTFRAGGPARYFVSPAGEEELSGILRLCRRESMPFYILGNGSNLLIADQGFDGVMVEMGEHFSWIKKKNEKSQSEDGVFLEAGSGLQLSRIAREALSESLTGFEFAAGIPGTLGGAVVMNAGAYGGEMRDVLVSARVLAPSGEILCLDMSQLELGYRRSCIPERGYVVLSAVIRLKNGREAEIRERMDDLAARRREKQPLEYPSAGSTFKRPEGYFAGKLIEEAGLRGYRNGGAQVSEKHCGFVINRDNATAGEIFELCRIVQDRVFANAGVRLETEIKMLGFEEKQRR